MSATRIVARSRRAGIAVVLFGALVAAARPVHAQPTLAGAASSSATPKNGDIQHALNSAYAKYKDLKEGKNADYIPALAKVDPGLYGIALVTADGRVFTAGDSTTEVSIQSISKVFTLARVLQDSGAAPIVKGVGVDATGQPFNSIIAIEQHKGHEMNQIGR